MIYAIVAVLYDSTTSFLFLQVMLIILYLYLPLKSGFMLNFVMVTLSSYNGFFRS